jgi:hypothetical protein
MQQADASVTMRDHDIEPLEPRDFLILFVLFIGLLVVVYAGASAIKEGRKDFTATPVIAR